MSHSFLRLVFILSLVAALFSLLNSSVARADNPDFSNVSDVLAGRRTLFPDDDYVLTLSYVGQPVTNNRVTILQGFADQLTSYTVTNQQSNFATALGRMFDLPRDVVVTATTNIVQVTDFDPNGTQTLTYPFPGEAYQDAIAMADYNGDGFEEFVLAATGQLFPIMPYEIENFSEGLFLDTTTAPTLGFTNLTTLAAGDFDGDGNKELAVAVVMDTAIEIYVYDVSITIIDGQAQDFSLNQIGSGTLSVPFLSVDQISIVAGRFVNQINPTTLLPQEQMMLVYLNTSSNQLIAQGLEFAANIQPNPAQSFVIKNNVGEGNILEGVASAPLDFFGPTDQLIVGYNSPHGIVAVITTSSQFVLNTASSTTMPENQTIVGMAVGNFDQSIDGSKQLALQIYAMTYNNGNFVPIYIEVDPTNNFALSAGQQTVIYPGGQGNDDFFTASITAGDTQGRSLILGPPSKLVVQHKQPHVILAMPPMHVDYVPPVNETEPQVLNLTAIPDGFFSSYSTSVTNQNQSSHQGTTSFTNAAELTTSAGYSWGVPDGPSVSVKVTASVGAMHQNVVSKTYNTYTSESFDASTQTGFDDQIWYNSEQHNVYVYPVIGQLTCPETKPNCGASDMVPLVVMFSGPDSISQTSIGGGNVEWYQPVREPGSVFSYPWNLQQLQLINPDSPLLTSSSPTTFYTDSSTNTERAQWTGQNSENASTGSTTNINWGSSISISKKAGVTGGFSGSLKFSYNGSKGLSTLNTSTLTLGESTGIGINKPGTFTQTSEYEYAILPFITGDNPVTGTLQTFNLNTAVQTNGIVRAEFTADPTDPNAGSWWQPTYTLPDIALNHPARWNVVQNDVNAPSATCLPVSSTVTAVDCVTFNANIPNADPWTNEFLWMKGLFITPADANGAGPQIDQATAGDEILLQARVYNYSLVDMPPNSGVVVQFYGQPWDQTSLQPTGDAFLIENVTIGAIPGFNSQTTGGGTLPNWALAQTDQLNTAAYGDQYLAFWVLVVLKDAQGNPLPEMPGHGLYGVPPTLSSITEATEWTEEYSNNVGLYKSLFYIAASGTERSLAMYSSPRSTSAQARLQMDPIQLSKQTALLNDKVIVSANIRTNTAREDLTVLFYDGDPDKGGKAFEYEGISHLRGGDAHQVKTIYHAQECGTHKIILELQPGGKRGQATLEVTINARAAVRQLIKQVKALGLKGRSGGGMMELLKEANKAFKNHDNKAGLDALEKFQERVQAQRGNKIPADQADLMLAILAQIFACVKP